MGSNLFVKEIKVKHWREKQKKSEGKVDRCM